MEIPQISSHSSTKNAFLLSKEKFWGGLVTAGGVLLIGGLLFLIGPTILTLLGIAVSIVGKTIILAILATVLGIFLAVMLNPKTWALFNYQYAILARKITKAMVRFAPVDMLKAYSEEFLEKKLETFQKMLTIVRQQIDKLIQLINDNQERRDKAFEEARFLKSQSYDEAHRNWSNEEDHNHFRLRSQLVNQLEASNKRLNGQRERLSMLEAILTKWERAFRFKIDEIQQWVEVITIEYEALKAAAHAGNQAISVVAGDEQQRIFNLAAETVRDDIAMFQGQIETALALANQMTSSQDIQSGAAEQQIMMALQQLDTNADALISDSEQRKQTLSSRDAGRIVGMMTSGQQQPVVQPVDFRRQSKYSLRSGKN